MMSPTTRMRVLVAAVRSWRTRDALSWLGFMERDAGSTKEGSEWTGGAGPWLFGSQTDFVGSTASFDGHFECDSDSIRVAGDRNSGVDEDGISAHFHGFGGVAGRAESSINDNGHGRLLDDDPDLITGLNAAVGTDRRAERHDGGDADVL